MPVIFLNTGKLFGETLAYREELVERPGLADVRDIRPDPVDTAHADPGGLLWNSDADACCWIRKVLPLQRALDGFNAWITGRKQFQGGLRERMPVFEADNGRIKINPLARWSPERLRALHAAGRRAGQSEVRALDRFEQDRMRHSFHR